MISIWRKARFARAAGGAALLRLLLAICLGANPSASDGVRILYAVSDPSDAMLRELAARSDLDVRWVESGLVVFEAEPDRSVPPRWRAERIAMRQPGSDLGVLRGRDVDAMRKSDPAHAAHSRFVASARIARLGAEPAKCGSCRAASECRPISDARCLGLECRLDPRSLSTRAAAALASDPSPDGATAPTPRRATSRPIRCKQLSAHARFVRALRLFAERRAREVRRRSSNCMQRALMDPGAAVIASTSSQRHDFDDTTYT